MNNIGSERKFVKFTASDSSSDMSSTGKEAGGIDLGLSNKLGKMRLKDPSSPLGDGSRGNQGSVQRQQGQCDMRGQRDKAQGGPVRPIVKTDTPSKSETPQMNQFEKQWRSRGKPAKEITCVSTQQVRRELTAENIAQISKKTDCHIAPRSFGGNLILQIYGGEPKKIDKASHLIHEAIAVAQDTKKHGWMKVKAFDMNTWQEEEKQLIAAERKAAFKRDAPKDIEIPYQAVVEWSEECRLREIRVHQALGNNLEALDPIRVDDEVFITLRNTQPPSFLLQGFAESHVNVAMAHFQVLMKKVECSTYDAESIFLCIDEWKDSKVIFRKPTPGGREVVPIFQSPLFKSQREHLLTPSTLDLYLDPTKLRTIQSHLHTAIEAMRYRRGVFDLSIRLGTFYFKDGSPIDEISWSTGKFLKKLTGYSDRRQLGHNVTRNITDSETTANLLETLKSAGDLFAPLGWLSGSLQDIKPVYRSVFEIEDTSNRNQRVILQIEGQDDDENYLIQAPAEWHKFAPGKMTPASHLNINMLQLAEGTAWHFDLESTQYIKRAMVPRTWANFAETVTINPKKARNVNDNGAFHTYRQTPGIMIKGQKCERIWRFGIKGTDYRLEATRTSAPKKNALWSVTVRHADWPMHFRPLATLLEGEKAPWIDPVKVFFPDDGFMVPDQEQRQNKTLSELMALDEEEYAPAGKGIRLLVAKLIEISALLAPN